MTIRVMVITLLLAGSWAGAEAQDFLSKDGPVAAVKRTVGIDQKLNTQLPLDLEFTDSSGKAVRLGDYFGERPVLLVPVYYTCPMLCNMILDGVTQSIANLRFTPGKEYEIVTFSFDPADTPQAAAEKKSIYTRRYGRPGAEEGWHFLTGSEESIRRLTNAIGFRYTWDDNSKQFAHAAGVMLATPNGTLARYFYGMEYRPRDLRLGIVEAAEEKIGSPTDQFLLLCFDYDPATGKYSAIAMNTVRIGGATTIVLIGGMIALLARRGKKKAASEDGN
jgi:protein SCO1